MSRYDFTAIENKWQEIWEEKKPYAAVTGSPKPKYYGLIEFPYPSAQGLHVGHPRPFTAIDIVTRKRRMEGYNVLFPIGFDAFGLPTENYAIKTHTHPVVTTRQNIANFTKQLKMLGYGFDWDRCVETTDPKYFKWTQWIFLQMYKHGLAYKSSMPVNWCTSCKVVLANEEVVNGVCERCGGEVIRKEKSQWLLGITKYAQRLIDGLDTVDFIERAKIQEKNWIGRSTGAEVVFRTSAGDDLKVFTTRPDTLFGVTYMVLSPEHPFVEKWKDLTGNYDEISAYVKEAQKKSDFERSELNKEKTGVRIEGVTAINPVNGKEVPIFISDYVLITYGTGAIMAVPGHDTRDWEFAKKFGLDIVEVVEGGNIEEEAFTLKDDTGIMVNSGFLNGMTVKDAIPAITKWLQDNGLGEEKVNYKLRDWIFSRQRYWGEPIPMINCPKCGGPAQRETDTMPNWAGSSWYYLRYMDPHNDEEFVSKEAEEYWGPVDWYNGGMEHTTLHLLYSRFWHMFLYDIGVVHTPEPYAKRTSHGMILGEGGEKMSKSRGNVVNPNEIVEQYGADTMRLYIMFIGDFEKSVPWSNEAVKGCKRFLDRVWNLADMCSEEKGISKANEGAVNRTIKKVGEDIEQLKMNTAIAAMMTLVNDFYAKGLSKGDLKALLLLLSPFVPHIVEEMWEKLGFAEETGMMAMQNPWPSYDASKLIDSEKEIAVQVNGKLRSTIVIPLDSEDSFVVSKALEDEKVRRAVAGMEIVKKIVVKNRIVNLIVKPSK